MQGKRYSARKTCPPAPPTPPPKTFFLPRGGGPGETLKGRVGVARLSASSANLQPLKYILSFDQVTNSRVFPSLSWAGYLKDWPGPREGERPWAYIIGLGGPGGNGSF